MSQSNDLNENNISEIEKKGNVHHSLTDEAEQKFEIKTEKIDQTISEETKKKVTDILEEVKQLSDIEKLFLYVQLPTGACPVDPLKRRNQSNSLSKKADVEIAQTYTWIRTHLEEDPDVSLPKHEVYEEYKVFCDANRFEPLCAADFGKVMKHVFPSVKPRRLGTRGNSRYCYSGLKKKLNIELPLLPDVNAEEKQQDKSKQKNNEEINTAACHLIFEWAEKLLSKKFSSMKDLAIHLIDNLYIDPHSVAAFTVLSTPSIQNKETGFSATNLLKQVSKSQRRETRVYLQRKISEKEAVKEHRRKPIQSFVQTSTTTNNHISKNILTNSMEKESVQLECTGMKKSSESAEFNASLPEPNQDIIQHKLYLNVDNKITSLEAKNCLNSDMFPKDTSSINLSSENHYTNDSKCISSVILPSEIQLHSSEQQIHNSKPKSHPSTPALPEINRISKEVNNSYKGNETVEEKEQTFISENSFSPTFFDSRSISNNEKCYDQDEMHSTVYKDLTPQEIVKGYEVAANIKKEYSEDCSKSEVNLVGNNIVECQSTKRQLEEMDTVFTTKVTRLDNPFMYDRNFDENILSDINYQNRLDNKNIYEMSSTTRSGMFVNNSNPIFAEEANLQQTDFEKDDNFNIPQNINQQAENKKFKHNSSQLSQLRMLLEQNLPNTDNNSRIRTNLYNSDLQQCEAFDLQEVMCDNKMNFNKILATNSEEQWQNNIPKNFHTPKPAETERKSTNRSSYIINHFRYQPNTVISANNALHNEISSTPDMHQTHFHDYSDSYGISSLPSNAVKSAKAFHFTPISPRHTPFSDHLTSPPEYHQRSLEHSQPTSAVSSPFMSPRNTPVPYSKLNAQENTKQTVCQNYSSPNSPFLLPQPTPAPISRLRHHSSHTLGQVPYTQTVNMQNYSNINTPSTNIPRSRTLSGPAGSKHSLMIHKNEKNSNLTQLYDTGFQSIFTSGVPTTVTDFVCNTQSVHENAGNQIAPTYQVPIEKNQNNPQYVQIQHTDVELLNKDKWQQLNHRQPSFVSFTNEMSKEFSTNYASQEAQVQKSGPHYSRCHSVPPHQMLQVFMDQYSPIDSPENISKSYPTTPVIKQAFQFPSFHSPQYKLPESSNITCQQNENMPKIPMNEWSNNNSDCQEAVIELLEQQPLDTLQSALDDLKNCDDEFSKFTQQLENNNR